jgi:outer membrane protein OmpA-like peptidoglycan-associated protein
MKVLGFRSISRNLVQNKVSSAMVLALLTGLLAIPGTAPASAAYQTISLEAPGTSKVELGALASRSASTPALQLPLTKTGTTNAYVYAGSDSQTANAFTFNSRKNYTSVSNLKQSIDVTAGNNISTGSATSQTYLSRTATKLFSSGTVARTYGGTSYTQASGDAFMSYFGPEVYSVPFIGTVGQSLAFSWAAAGTGDDYEIYAFLVKTSNATDATCTNSSGNGSYGLTNPTSTHTLLTYSRGISQPWTDASAEIPSDGCYRFRFVSGTYDATGGTVVGGELYVGASTIYLGLTQTITYPQPSDVTASSSSTVNLGASTNATGATLVYTSNSASSICTVNSSGMVTVVGVGVCSVTVSSDAYGDYTAATSITRSFTISAVPASSVTTAKPGSLLTFMPNGADNFAYPQSPLLGETVPLWKNMLVRVGYLFTGWNTKADGTGTSYADQALFKFSEAFMTLFAQWKLIQIKPTITWATPAAIQEGTPLSATQLNALASVPGTYTYAPAATTALAVGKHTLKVTFVPTDAKYETIETTVEIEVLAKAKLTWANPAAIVEGTALSATQLNATASVPGTFVYSPATGALLPVGKNTLKVTFTPTDSRLSPVTAEVTIDVTAKPVVVEPAPGAPVSPSYAVSGLPKTIISWGAGKDAATYTVLVDGKNACAVATLSCEVAQLLGPKNLVTVTSVAKNTKTSAAIKANYVAPGESQVLSVVNFDTARSVLKSSETAKLRAFAATVKAAGYTSLTVYGHTDSVGGVDNQKLSVARARATITYLKKLLPTVKFVVSGFAASEPVGDNATNQGKAANRRAEIFIP